MGNCARIRARAASFARERRHHVRLDPRRQHGVHGNAVAGELARAALAVSASVPALLAGVMAADGPAR